MTGLEDYTDDRQSQQKQTHITFSNVDHPDSRGDYAEEEKMRKHYQAAKSLKDTSVNRKRIVGDFLVAVDKEVTQGNEGAIEELFEGFSG
ncbi:hypothetical protein GCM10008995_26460 [Halobellus salinus]|uniref:Uncharacterized protein n=1 Tax=Halobellus salinus TaxID=931585 RepID=A0A830EDL4_9EURY|nr:hypothetical protein [Halobellus salinus]GGJ15339.1 hypothetical protein GCM10008995_26460 [Halobellus salinus]SMP25147.1 hypothetical protein SAMN06265347_110113 [Halobellus salinus]